MFETALPTFKSWVAFQRLGSPMIPLHNSLISLHVFGDPPTFDDFPTRAKFWFGDLPTETYAEFLMSDMLVKNRG